MTIHSSILAWGIPWTESHGELQSIRSQRVGRDWVTNMFSFQIPDWKQRFRYMYTYIHGSITHNSQKVQTTQMSINWWMDKQNVVCPHDGILFSHEKNGSTDTCYNTGEPWWHHAKWKKPVSRPHSAELRFIWNVHKRRNRRARKQIGRACRGSREQRPTLKGTSFGESA